MVNRAVRFSKCSWACLHQVSFIAKHKGQLFALLSSKTSLFYHLLQKQVSFRVPSFSMPCYAYERSLNAGLNASWITQNGCDMKEKSKFTFLHPKILSIDLLDWFCFTINYAWIMIRLASLMLLAWLILISGHMKFFELIVMNVCSCCLNSYHVQDFSFDYVCCVWLWPFDVAWCEYLPCCMGFVGLIFICSCRFWTMKVDWMPCCYMNLLCPEFLPWLCLCLLLVNDVLMLVFFELVLILTDNAMLLFLVESLFW